MATFRIGFLTLVSLFLVTGGFPTTAAGQQLTEVEVHWGVQVPLRDGVRLNATVYRPYRQESPLPVIVTMTPYTADTYHERGWYFAQRGYVFALVDVRGRGNSEGDFDPFFHDAEDGYDVVEWFADQPWSNGKTGLWGGSYAGTNQWMTAKEFPPHLSTIVPAAAAFMAVDVPFRGNVFAPYFIQWMTLTSGVTANFQLFGQSEYWNSVYMRLYREHRPLTELPEIANNRTTRFDKWLSRPSQGEFWDQYNPRDQDFRDFDLPVLTITGHYDGDQPGAMEYFRKHMRLGSPRARARHFLVVGPWDHSGTRTPRRSFGGLDFGPASMVDLNQLHLQWYDWTMKDGPRPDFLKKRIAFYVAGAGQWKYVDSLDEIADRRQRLFLNSREGRAGSLFHSGSLQADAPGGESVPDSYTYDPLDTDPGRLDLNPSPSYLTDQSRVNAIDGDGLVYHSEPFEAATEVTGYLKLVAWIEMDVPDTDFAVSVSEVLADGSSVHLTETIRRARYRESLREARLVEPGSVLRYEFDGFKFFSRQIAEGSRLRLVLSAPNSITSEKNYNSGGVVAEESGADARTAHVKLFHDARHESYLELPINQN